ncbi:MAG TPA: tetratricopeptide repeat protein, partial [Ktedonobacteraceae bacterium]|nr:tetratricopeptide repeat protein [Ktedonobacteraceae bacterium]
MPKAARYTLIWSEARQLYALFEDGRQVLWAHDAAWLEWLTAHTAFAFQDRDCRFNLLKERRRQDGEGYWYAYQRQGRQTVKRYVGKSAEVVPARLEEIARTFQAAPPALPLLIPKMQLPHPSAELVRRERLLIALDAGRQRTLTLLAAPAGSGKTSLVAQWIAARRSEVEPFPPVAWVALDKNDNDPARFWRYVIKACQVFAPGCGEQALHQLAAVSTFPPALDQLAAILAPFLNDLAVSSGEGLLVLDDYQAITSAQIHQTLAFFVEHLPPSLHLLLLTRGGAAVPVARLRARGALCEIEAGDLRFSWEETRLFLGQSFPRLQSAALLTQIHTLLEGWASGLRLFALALPRDASEEQIRRQLAGFAGEHRQLQAYFLEEVLAALSVPQQTFLLRTSLLPRLNADLCAALMGKRESAELLPTLEQSGLFLERLDGPGAWFRYQTLFAEAMRAEARRRFTAQTIHKLLLQAARWYERAGWLAEAIELALQAQEMGYALLLVERELGQRGFDEMQEFATLRRWLEPVPAELLGSHPLLCLCKAQVLSLNFVQEQLPSETLAQINELLSMAEARWQEEGHTASLGEVRAFRAYLAVRQGWQEQAGVHARQALSWLPPASRHWRGVCLNLLGSGALSRGRVSEAGTLLQTALAIWEELHHPHGARSCTLLLATVYHEQGRLRLAEACYQRVAQEAREIGDREDLVPALLGLAHLAYEWNDLEAAERSAQEARDVSEQASYHPLLVRATLLLLRIWSLQGQKLLVEHHLSALLARFHAHQ